MQPVCSTLLLSTPFHSILVVAQSLGPLMKCVARAPTIPTTLNRLCPTERGRPMSMYRTLTAQNGALKETHK